MEKNYFLNDTGKIERRYSSVEMLTSRSTDKNYIYIEFFSSYSLADVHQCLTDDDLKQIRYGNTMLVLSNTHEAFHDVVEAIYIEVVVKLSIPPNNIVLISESAIINLEVNRVATKLGLSRIHSEWSRIFEHSTALVKGNFPGLNVNKQYQKKFLNLNRRWRLHRPVFVALLKVHGLLDAGYVSFAENVEGNNWNTNWDKVTHLEPSLLPYKDEIINMSPLYLDTNDLTINQAALTHSTDEYYEDTYFSVVSETNFYEHLDVGLFLSEKTFKPIKMLHPFILLNRPHALEALRSIGYETFSEIIDESYDKEEDDRKRMMMVLEETKRLSSLRPEELIDFINKSKQICTHNSHILNSKNDWVTKL